MPTRHHRAVFAIGLTAIALVGCAAPSTEAPAPAPSASASFTTENCGVPVSLSAPPTRVIAVKSTAIEMMLALGVEEAITGVAFVDGPFDTRWAAAAADISVISERVPNREATLARQPDMIYAGWESVFSADGVGERDDLESVGIASYVSPAACKSAGVPIRPLTFDDVFAEITEAGALFGAEPAAAALVAEQRNAMDAIPADERALSALWYSSGSDAPYVGGSLGAPALVMETAGLTNVFGDLDQTWTNVSWESVGALDPDVIVLVESDWGTAQKKIGVLEANPVARQLSAVRDARYIVVPFAAGEAGVRTAEAVQIISDALQDNPQW